MHNGSNIKLEVECPTCKFILVTAKKKLGKIVKCPLCSCRFAVMTSDVVDVIDPWVLMEQGLCFVWSCH